jgi:hypothetical protein
MKRFRILNSRKRAIIAPVHSAVFSLLAIYQFVIRYHPRPLLLATLHVAGPLVLTFVYFIVTAVLLMLFAISASAFERLYFFFCATSAGTGLIRVAIGDSTIDAGNLMRVMMLGCAVISGWIVLRQHSAGRCECTD